MKPIFAIACSLLFLFCSTTSMAASNLTRVTPPDDLASIMNMKGVDDEVDEDNVSQALHLSDMRKVAEAIGTQKGYIHRVSQYMELMQAKEDHFDYVFDFKQLMAAVEDDSGVNELYMYRLPAVIQEAKNHISSASANYVTATGAVYKIVKPARLTTMPPTWRDYLMISTNIGFNKPAVQMLPKNDVEQAVWADHVALGWSRGLKQADTEMNIRIERLRTDFLGMSKSLRLVEQGMLDQEHVAVQNTMISGGGVELLLDQTTYQLTSPAGFNTDYSRWDARTLDRRESFRAKE